MEIRAIDNFLLDNDFNQVLMYCKNATYSYGETDNGIPGENDEYCVGMIHQMYPQYNIESKNQSIILNLITEECKSQFPEINEYDLSRMYINCFSPGENPYFHTDSINSSYTCLFYANNKWDLDDGGETQFYIDDILYGVPPEPNRMVIFDGRIKHRATSFRNRHRFTIAAKYVLPLS